MGSERRPWGKGPLGIFELNIRSQRRNESVPLRSDWIGSDLETECHRNKPRQIVLKRVCCHPHPMRNFLFAVFLAASAPASAQTLSGPVEIVDGDSLSVSGISVRLFGIDAPEGKQTCHRGGATWRCGEEAATRLRNLIGGNPIECRGRGIDTYSRTLAVCSVAGIEINRAMVEAGWATAFRKYSQDYVVEETRARAGRRGIWSSEFQLPEDYRAAQNAAREATPAPLYRRQASRSFEQQVSGCSIKGNRNRKGQWIYHLPGMPYYAITRAEEMFCSEAQAQAAGYRRAIVR
jgi:endonuclease YncB( thermonuclease family)